MKQSKFERIMRNVYETRDEEISCTECFDQVSDYVDLEIAGEDAAQKMPRAKQHFDQCRVCREEYETLLDLARLEAAKDDSHS
jgi:predicted anti-sigma-YlaC factor YlaD